MKKGELLRSKHVREQIGECLEQLFELIWRTDPVYIILIAIGLFLWYIAIIIGCYAWNDYNKKRKLLTINSPRNELHQALTPISVHHQAGTPSMHCFDSDHIGINNCNEADEPKTHDSTDDML